MIDFETMIEKPKITKGEWKCFSDGTNKEDAQAISSVPDMIDALIESYKLVTRELAEETGTPTDELIKLATLQEEALEKAGCKLL